MTLLNRGNPNPNQLHNQTRAQRQRVAAEKEKQGHRSMWRCLCRHMTLWPCFDVVPVVGLDLPCGAGHLGLRCAPGTSPSALGFESRLIKMQKKGPNGPFFLHGAGGGTRTHTMSPSADFESATSTIPSHRRAVAKYISFSHRIQVFPLAQIKRLGSLCLPSQDLVMEVRALLCCAVSITMNIFLRNVTNALQKSRT